MAEKSKKYYRGHIEQNDGVCYKLSPKTERFIYVSLARLGGVVIGLITYFKLVQPLISR
ncbi:MAG: hypothetical protein AAB876_03270 [Patescibacteria group bacterium]